MRQQFKQVICTLYILLSMIVQLHANVEYVSQMESEIDPKIMCFPASMINAAISSGHKYDTNALDDYDSFMHSEIVTNYVYFYAPRYISRMIASEEVDIREMWQIEEMAFNAFAGYKICTLKTHRVLSELIDDIDKGSVVISGKLAGRNHCVTVTNIRDNIVEIIDPYGDPNANYSNTDKYAIITMSLDKFRYTFKQSDGRYTYIAFSDIKQSDDVETNIVSVLNDIDCTSRFISQINQVTHSVINESNVEKSYTRYLEVSKCLNDSKILSILSYKTLLEAFIENGLSDIDLNSVIHYTVSLEIDTKLALYVYLYEKLSDIEVDPRHILSANLSSDRLEEQFYISCMGYKDYIFGSVSDMCTEMYASITEIISPFVQIIDNIVLLDVSDIKDYINGKLSLTKCLFEPLDIPNMFSLYKDPLYFADNKRRLFDRIGERTGKGYSIENLSVFVISF